MYYVDFAENVLFSCFGVVCLQLPSDGQNEHQWVLAKCVVSAIASMRLLLTNRQRNNR